MKTINSLSGGKTSSYMAVKFPADFNIFALVCIDDIKTRPKDKSIVNYVSEKIKTDFIATAEDDKTLYLMRDLEQFIGKEIIWVKGKTFDNVLQSNTTRLPNRRFRYCTTEMKIKPIFEYWYMNFDDKVKMNIGFRFDEYKRMENFYNRNPNFYKIPVSSNKNTKRQQIKNINWRSSHFPMIENKIYKKDVDDFWKKTKIKATLFEKEREFVFPQVSNCIGCFHKSKPILRAMHELYPEKMDWFAKAETIGKGTWHDDKIPYSQIFKNKADETTYEVKNNIFTCDSGGCSE